MASLMAQNLWMVSHICLWDLWDIVIDLANWQKISEDDEDDEDEPHQTPNKDSRERFAKINQAMKAMKAMWLYQDRRWIWCFGTKSRQVNSTFRRFKAHEMDATWCNLFRDYLQIFVMHIMWKSMHHGTFRIISTGHWPSLVVPMLEDGRFVCRAWTMSRHKAHKAAGWVQLDMTWYDYTGYGNIRKY